MEQISSTSENCILYQYLNCLSVMNIFNDVYKKDKHLLILGQTPMFETFIESIAFYCNKS